MKAALSHADEFLRGSGLFRPESSVHRPGWWLPAVILAAGPIYGAMMGSFHLVAAERVLLVVFAGVKVPLLLLATSALCLPAFFVLNTVLGLRDDFRQALQAILAGQAGLSLSLAALAPLTRFWYFSTPSYRAALLFNAAMFTLATIAGHVVMLRYYRVLIRRNGRHRVMLLGWLAMYIFVGIQMGWTLRPFIGDPNAPVAFFRQEPFTNAYVVVFHLIVGAR
jgi:hypothetical protein